MKEIEDKTFEYNNIEPIMLVILAGTLGLLPFLSTSGSAHMGIGSIIFLFLAIPTLVLILGEMLKKIKNG